MPKRNKGKKQDKAAIPCGFGAECFRRDCNFQHPESWDVEAKIAQARQNQHKNQLDLQQRQEKFINRRCPRDDVCAILSCPFRHSPNWNPVENQRLAEENRRRKESQREQERQHALHVTGDLPAQPSAQHHMASQQWKSTVEEEYAYDDAYLDVYEKVWHKQNQRSIGRW